MSFRDTHIHGGVLGVTALFALLSLLRVELLESTQYVLLAAGTMFIGIPHGATDNYLFARANVGRRMAAFYATYLLVAIIYGVLWAVVPGVSLLFFLLISIYHFGQSNLFYTELPEGAGRKKLIYLSWGAFNLASPLLFRYDQAEPVIRYLIGHSPISVASAHAVAPYVSGGLLLLNSAILLFLHRTGKLTSRDLAKELVAFGLLFVLYAFAPLYVSFIVYWAFWHSLNSAIEIAETWEYRSPRERIAAFYRSALPLSLITFAGMGVIFLIAGVYGSRDALLGLFFVIIAAVTLPHTAIMELLYREKSTASA